MEQIHNGFEKRLAAGCQSRFWVLWDAGKRKEVAPFHPGAVEISCGKCLACQIVRRDRHVGRMVAASVTCAGTVFLTLTYAPKGADGVDPEGAKAILPEHMVAFRKSMRDSHGKLEPRKGRGGVVVHVHRGKFQYCGAGELGELKRRVHWHIILFFDDKESIPEWVHLPQRAARDYLNAKRSGGMDADGSFVSCGVKCKAQYSIKKRTDEFVAWLPEWPHGYVNIQEVGEKGPGYIAKYMMKPNKAAVLRGEGSVHNSVETYKVVSQKLGYGFIRELGNRTAKAGLGLSAVYSVDNQRVTRGPRAGEFRTYTMTRAMKREYVNAYLQEIARQLATGERSHWVAPVTGEKGDPMGARLDADAERDPRDLAERFFAKLQRGKRGPSSLPWLDLSDISRAISTPDQGVLVKTSRGEYVFTWPDLSGHGRDIRIPVRNRRELFQSVRVGGVRAFGLLSPSAETVDGERLSPSALAPGRGAAGRGQRFAIVNGEWQRVFPLRQVLEHGGAGLASEADRADARRTLAAKLAEWEASGGEGQRPKRRALRMDVRRAWATSAQVDDLRLRIVAQMVARWSPEPESLAGGVVVDPVTGRERNVQGVGIPFRFAGSSLTSEQAARWPLFAKWFREANPDAPPF